MKEIRIVNNKIRRIDKRVAISKFIIEIITFLISLYIYGKINSNFDNLAGKILLAVLVFILTNLILLGLLSLIFGLILGRDNFLKLMGIEPHDHRYSDILGIFFIIRNIFRLRR